MARRRWTKAQRERQARLIHEWQPWKKSTGPRTDEGKQRSALNSSFIPLDSKGPLAKLKGKWPPGYIPTATEIIAALEEDRKVEQQEVLSRWAKLFQEGAEQRTTAKTAAEHEHRPTKAGQAWHCKCPACLAIAKRQSQQTPHRRQPS